MNAGRSNVLRSAALGGLFLSIALAEAATSRRPAPDWVKEIAPGTWAEVGFNTLADVDPAKDPAINPNYPRLPPWSSYGQYPVLDAWNGGAYAEAYGKAGSLIVCGAGHADYHGNEIYAFDLDTRLWLRVTNPYPSPVFPVADGIWPDGTPSVAHTYDQLDYHAGTNSFVMMRTKHGAETGTTVTPIVAMLSLGNLREPSTNDNRDANKLNWRFSPVHTDNYVSSGGWSAFDSKRDLFWAQGGGGYGVMVSFDPKPVQDNGRYGSFRSYPIRTDAGHAAAAYDPINDILLVTAFRNSTDVIAIDLKEPGSGARGNVKLTQTGSPPTREQSHGWEWSPTRRAFVYYRRDADVYEFKQQGTDWRTGSWRWTRLTSSDNYVIPGPPKTNGTNGPFGRFRIASFDDAEIALVVTRVDGPVYAFRVPPNTIPRPRQPQALEARR